MLCPPPLTVARRLRKSINAFFNISDTISNPAAVLADQAYESFRDGFAELKGPDLDEMLSMATSGSVSIKTSEVIFSGGRWLSLVFSSTWDGGTHPQNESRYAVYDLQTGGKLGLGDILSPQGRRKLPNLLALELRHQYKLESTAPLTEAGLENNSIGPNDNFYITQTGIGFFFNNYEIASFAAGSYNLFIPFSRFAAGELVLPKGG